MAMIAEHRSKFAALHRQWWHLHMSEDDKPQQTNKHEQEAYAFVQFSDLAEN